MAFICEKELPSISRRVQFLDVRFYLDNPSGGKNDFAVSRLPGAIFADVDHDLSDPQAKGVGRHPLPPADRFLAWLASHDLFPWRSDVTIVCYDQNRGEFASRAWWMLRSLGCGNVRILHNGFSSWKGEIESSNIRESQKLNDKAPAVHIHLPDWGHVRAFSPVGIDALRDSVVVDARSSTRFQSVGEAVLPDILPGHFPNAHNVFYRDFDPFSPESKQKLRGFEQLVSGGSCIMMCGSGITSCYLIACLAHFRFPFPKLYVGSWSEIEMMHFDGRLPATHGL